MNAKDIMTQAVEREQEILRLKGINAELVEALERLMMDGDVRDAAEKGALTQALAALTKAKS